MKSNRTPFSDVCSLIAVTKIPATGRHYSTEETATEIFCSVSKGVARTEFYEAMKAGKKLTATFEIYEDEYDGQELLEHEGKRYKIARTFPTGHGTLELSCEEVIR